MAEIKYTGRLKLRYDTYANWYNNNPTLLRGEVAIALVDMLSDEVKAEGIKSYPTVIIKVGDNSGSDFRTLKPISALSADVINACKSDEALVEAVSQILVNKEIPTQESIQSLQSQINTNSTAIATLNGGSTVEGSVAKSIQDAITNLNLAETYETKGAAADALSQAKTYTDTNISNLNTQLQAEVTRSTNADTALDTRVGTAETQISELTAKVGDLTGAFKFKGEIDSDPTAEGFDITDYDNGDVVIFGNKEFAFDGTKFIELGDEGSFASKTYVDSTFETKADATQKFDAAKAHADSLNSAMDIRTKALEDSSHTHENKDILDGINSTTITKINASVDDVQADTGLKVERVEGSSSVKLGLDTDVTFVIDCGTSTHE